MTTSLVKYAAAAAISLCASLALAQTNAQTPAKPVATGPAASAPAPAKPRGALSLECSKKADAQGLHGKARKKFRSACKHGKA